TSGADVIVAEGNIQGGDSSSSHARTGIGYLAALSPQPQVVVLTEARGTNFDTYIRELQSRTSYTWPGALPSDGPNSPWSGRRLRSSEDEGTVILTMLPVVDSSSTYLPYSDGYHSARALVRLAVSANGATVNVFGTHLQVGNASARYSSISYLKNWASNYSG